MTWLNAPSGKKQDRLPVRAAEHNVIIASGDGKEEASVTCTVITTLLDHEAAPATRCGTRISPGGASGPRRGGQDHDHRADRTSGPVLRSGSPRLVIQEAWAWLPPPSWCAPAKPPRCAARRQPPRAAPPDAVPVTADEDPSPPPASTCSAPWNPPSHGHLVTGRDHRRSRRRRPRRAARPERPGRQRHSRRAQKARPKFPHATGTKTTVTGKPQVTVFASGFC